MSFGCWRGSAVAVSDPAQIMGAVVHHVEDQPDLGRPDLLGFTAPEYRSVRATEAAPFTEAADAERSLAAVGLDYWIWHGRTSRLRSSLSDHSGCLPARALPARLTDGAGAAPGIVGWPRKWDYTSWRGPGRPSTAASAAPSGASRVIPVLLAFAAWRAGWGNVGDSCRADRPPLGGARACLRVSGWKGSISSGTLEGLRCECDGGSRGAGGLLVPVLLGRELF